MPRDRIATDAEINRARVSSRSVAEMSAKLGMSTVSVYQHLRRLGLKPPKSADTGSGKSITVYEAYRGRTPLDDLMSKFGVGRPTIRYHIQNGMSNVWRIQPPTWEGVVLPIPDKLEHVKIVHELVADPSSMNDPEGIAERTDIRVASVNEYLARVMENIGSQQRKEPRRGKRSVQRPH